MSQVKISSNLFLGSPEIKRLQKSLDEDGFRKNIIQNSVKYGLIKSDQELTFLNAKVSQDTDVILSGNSFKTIQIQPIEGIDKDGLYFSKDLTKNIPIPTIDQWYWIRVSHQYKHEEKGTWNLSADGILTGVNGELTKILRGSPNFPSKIVFTNALLNTSEYDILNVIDNNNLVLSGLSFQTETNLTFAIVGTFTYGASIDSANKLIFNYDDCLIELIAEDPTTNNSRPTLGYQEGKTFYLSRLKISNDQIILQDKRTKFWETKGSFESKDIEILGNPLIGIENIKFGHPFSSGDKNIVEVAWSLRSQNWDINSSLNTVTISSGLGGIFKSVGDFTDGDFNGWRLYAPNGTYSKIISSIKQGNAINCKLDQLDVDNFSTNGGETFVSTLGQYINITPNADDIEIIFKPDVDDLIQTQIQTFEFPINSLIGKCNTLVYKDPFCFFQVKYRYKHNSTYSSERFFDSDSVGYFNESSFDDSGNLKSSGLTQRVPYTLDLVHGYIKMVLSPNAYKRFVFKVDKGDLIGINKITDVTGITQIPLTVGQSLNYILFQGNLTLDDNLLIQINNLNQVNGNEFRIHFNATSLNLNSFNIIISAASNGGGSIPLKTITQGDVYEMLNTENGIVIDLICDGNIWYANQDYNLGRPNEVIDIYNTVPNSIFDATTKKGKVRGLFGYRISDGQEGSPDLRGQFIVGLNENDIDYSIPGKTGGSKNHVLTLDEMPSHNHSLFLVNEGTRFTGSGGANELNSGNGSTGSAGSNQAHENRPPFFTLIKVYKLY
jgi:microcystin-dependent protein